MSSQFTKYLLHTERDPVSWEFYKRQEACDWSSEEFRFTKDRDDYMESNSRIKELLKRYFWFLFNWRWFNFRRHCRFNPGSY